MEAVGCHVAEIRRILILQGEVELVRERLHDDGEVFSLKLRISALRRDAAQQVRKSDGYRASHYFQTKSSYTIKLPTSMRLKSVDDFSQCLQRLQQLTGKTKV